jgi:hypothetical protein
MQLEQNPTNNQTELDSKKQKLKELQDQEKTLTKSLPTNTQITLLKKEIKDLENKSNKTQTEQALLDSKKKELEELLKKQSNSNATDNKPSDRTGLYVGLGIVGIVLIFGVFIMTIIRKRKLKK